MKKKYKIHVISTSGFGDHPDHEELRRYAEEHLPPQRALAVQQHCKVCPDCDLRRAMMTPREPRRRGITAFSRRVEREGRFRVVHTIDANTISIAVPENAGADMTVGEELEILILKPDSPLSRADERALMDFLWRAWDMRGLQRLPSVIERLRRGHLVIVAVRAGAKNLEPVGVLVGRFSGLREPTFDELQRLPAVAEHEIETINFYQVAVDTDARDHRLSLRMLQAAVNHVVGRGRNIVIRTVSPMPGFRRCIGHLVGADLPRPEGSVLLEVERRWRSIDTSSILDEELAQLGRARAILMRKYGDIRRWLRSTCEEPDMLWRCRLSAAKLERWAIDQLFMHLARRFAERIWVPRRYATHRVHLPELLCYVSHFHRAQGAEVDGYRVFSRRNDGESIGMTMSFRYPIDDLRRVRNEQVFTSMRARVAC